MNLIQCIISFVEKLMPFLMYYIFISKNFLSIFTTYCKYVTMRNINQMKFLSLKSLEKHLIYLINILVVDGERKRERETETEKVLKNYKHKHTIN